VATFLCDLAFWQRGNPAWSTAALWLLGAGLVMAALAAVARLTDFLGDQRIRGLSTAWWHAGGNVAAVLIALFNFYARIVGGPDAVIPTGLVLSLIVAGILLFTSWLGAELVFRGRVGVAGDED